MLPRNVRDNNPGNMILGPDWKGLIHSTIEKRFCVFNSPVYGFRAMAKQLFAYQHGHNLWSIKDIIDRWAPPFENNTKNYEQRVSKETGVGVTARFDLSVNSHLESMMKAITEVETDNVFDKFWKMDDLIKGIQNAK